MPILNGTQTADEQSIIVMRFNADSTVCVLLFSSMGIVGLNLMVAFIVILFVCPIPAGVTDPH